MPEISGTNAWLNAHPEKEKAIIGDLNFDMEGIRLALSRSYWIMQRTPDTFPSYINDIAQSMMEYVSELTRERVRYRANGYVAERRHQSRRPAASDAFYIKIDKHYGSSDHVTYMQHGIPAVMFITWPDMWYHSSEDTPDKQDPTQYKRAAVVGTGALAVIATGGDADGRPRHHRESRTRQPSGSGIPSGRRSAISPTRRRRTRCWRRGRTRGSRSVIRPKWRRPSSDRRRCSTRIRPRP